MSVVLGDFRPVNNWKVDDKGPKWSKRNEPKFIIDLTTDRRYSNESKRTIRIKCALVALGTPLVHTIASIVNVVLNVLKLITLAHFWEPLAGEKKYDFNARLANAGADLLRVVATPLTIVGLELSGLYGLCRPHDGRKLYATIERAVYGHHILAPCFQPDPTSHLFGGNPDEKDVY